MRPRESATTYIPLPDMAPSQVRDEEDGRDWPDNQAARDIDRWPRHFLSYFWPSWSITRKARRLSVLWLFLVSLLGVVLFFIAKHYRSSAVSTTQPPIVPTAPTAIIPARPYVDDTTLAGSASSFAGATSTAVFPPPMFTAGGVNGSSYFPAASVVGFAGPTPTGDEAASVETAPAFGGVTSNSPLTYPNTSDHKTSFNVLQHLGNLSPFVSNPSLGLPSSSPQIPAGCSLEKVHILHRHGSRYPPAGYSPTTFSANIHQVASTTGFSASGPLSFLNTWNYRLGAEILTPYGRQQLFNLGVASRMRYGDLLKKFKRLPVFRTTSQARMLESAIHFTSGFFGVLSYQNDYFQSIAVEGSGFNTTLASYYACPNAGNEVAAYGENLAANWSTIYLKSAQERLQAFIRGYNLTIDNLRSMQDLCGYETVALGYSAFCDLFTEEEWKGYSYAYTLSFWYSYGPGNPATSGIGIGWVQELVARLTQTPLTDFSTSINSTLSGNNITFPLDQPIYVDATHDTVMTAIYTAMNFTSVTKLGPPPLDHIPSDRSYVVEQLVPFAANMVGQVLSCPASSQPTHIRWIINDAVVPLTGIKGCSSNSDGLCDLPTFIAGMKQRIAEVDFDFDCRANYTVPVPDNITTGQYPANLRHNTA